MNLVNILPCFILFITCQQPILISESSNFWHIFFFYEVVFFNWDEKKTKNADVTVIFTPKNIICSSLKSNKKCGQNGRLICIWIFWMFQCDIYRALLDIRSEPEIRQIFKIRTVRKPDVFLTGCQTFKKNPENFKEQKIII